MRKCTIEIGEKNYDLVLNRNSVKWLEQQGFDIEEFVKKPITSFDLLWESGFVANYGNLTVEEIDKLLEQYQEEGGDSNEVISFLAEEYTSFINALTDTKSKKKKATITK